MSLTITTSYTKPILIAFCVVAVLLTVIFSLSIRTANAVNVEDKLITIHDGEEETNIVTKAKNVKQALKSAKVTIGPYDNVDPSVDTPLPGKTYQINIYRAQPVMVVDGTVKKTVMTAYETPEQIAKDANIVLYEEDNTTLTRSQDILDSNGVGLTMTIDRATRFTLVLYGKLVETGTQSTTIGQMLNEKNIKLGKDDTLSLGVDAPIASGMRVEIWRNGKQTLSQEEPIAFTTQHIQDPNQPMGYRQVKTAGVLGKKIVTYEIEMRNGAEVARREIQSVQVQSPQVQVEIVGSKGTFSGTFGEALARLRSCEGGYTSINPVGYYGAYQFDIGTWGGYQGYPNAAAAPPAVQDQKAWETYQRRGWQPWPSCSRKLGLQDIYR